MLECGNVINVYNKDNQNSTITWTMCGREALSLIILLIFGKGRIIALSGSLKKQIKFIITHIQTNKLTFFSQTDSPPAWVVGTHGDEHVKDECSQV